MANVSDYASLAAFDEAFPTRTAARAYAYIVPVGPKFRSLSLIAFEPLATGGSGSETIEYVLQEAGPPNLTHQNIFDGVDDGGIKVNAGAPALERLAVPFTQDLVNHRTPIAIGLWLTRVGNPVKAGGGTPSIAVNILKDAAGVPDAAIGESYHIATADLPIGVPVLVLFGFSGCNEAVGSGDPFWVEITPSYDVSAGGTDCIQVHYNTVAGTSGCQKWQSAAWASIVNQDIWFSIYQLTFTDVSNDLLEGGGVISYQQDARSLNAIDGISERAVNLTRVKDYLRFRYIISGGNWYVRSWNLFGGATLAPLSPVVIN